MRRLLTLRCRRSGALLRTRLRKRKVLRIDVGDQIRLSRVLRDNLHPAFRDHMMLRVSLRNQICIQRLRVHSVIVESAGIIVRNFLPG